MNMALSPKVSIVIPTYQAERTIARAIYSVLQQTYLDFEILVVDNASKDRTREIVSGISAYDSRVIYIYSDTNLGPAGGRNRAINQAKGEFIAFLDADDKWEVDTKLAKQVKVLETNENIHLIFSDCQTFDEVTKQGTLYSVTNKINTRGIQFSPLNDFQDIYLLSGKLPSLLYSGNFICISTVVVRKSVLDQIGLFNPLLFGTEDIDLWIRLSANSIFCYWDEPTISYFWQESSISRINEKRIKELIKYHLFCKQSEDYDSMQVLVRHNLAYAYKLLILEYSRQWRPFEALCIFRESRKYDIKSLDLFFYTLASFFGPLPLFIKINVINRIFLRSNAT